MGRDEAGYADHLDFADQSFTHVLCSYVVFFFFDLSKVLQEIRRVLRADGVVGFAFERGADPRWTWFEETLRTLGAFDRMAPVPGVGAIRANDALVDRLESAGFAEAKEHVEEVELFYTDADAWWESLWTHGSRRALEVLTPGELDGLKTLSL